MVPLKYYVSDTFGSIAVVGFLTTGVQRLTMATATVSGTTTDSDDPHPVLLVHGFMDTRESPWWNVVVDRFVDAGYDPRLVRRLDQGGPPGTTVDSPRRYAEDVRRRVAELSRRFDRPVDVVAHSMGGLSARYCVEHLGGAEDVDSLVTLGTPHQGTLMATIGLTTPGGWAMLPGSNFLRTLNEGSLATDVEYISIWSTTDRTMIPTERARLPDTDGASAQNFKIDGVDHMGLVTDPNVFGAYLRRL
jgi:triacylglycerol esterase/lipase EstA (alpha/beta hydrolase family)